MDQLAKRTFRSHFVHIPVTEQSEGPMDTVASTVKGKKGKNSYSIDYLFR